MRTLCLLLLLAWPAMAPAQGTASAFTYQGELTQGGGVANGSFDFFATVYDAPSGGVPLLAQAFDDVPVTNGIFTLVIGTDLDPVAAVLDGSDRWLEIGVREGGSVGAYEFLAPLTQLRATPYALFALSGNEGPPGAPGDSHWQIDGTATYYTDGFVGVGSAAPLARLHVRHGTQLLLDTALLNEDVVIQDEDAVLGLYSSGGGGNGSVLVLGEVDGSGALLGKWSVLRRTAVAGDELWFTYGSDPAYNVNQRQLVLRPGGFAALGVTPPISEESTLTIEAGIDQHGVLVHSIEQFGSAIGLHAGPLGFSSVAKNGWFDGDQGGWNRFDVAMGAYLMETGPSGRTTFSTAAAGANPIAFSPALYLEGGDANLPGNLFLHSEDSADQFGALIQFPESGGSVWSIARDTTTGGDALRLTYSAATPGLADTRLVAGADGFGFNRSDTAFPVHVGTDGSNGNGAHLTVGGIWTNGSSRSFKEGFAAVDAGAVLAALLELPIQRWRYRGGDGAMHLGPVAEDFARVFGLGHDPRYIGTVDADGVALAAIQGLHAVVEQKQRRIEALEARHDEQQRRLQALAARIEALEAGR